MSEMVQLAGELRQNSGTGSARSLRNEKKIPAVIYGNGKQNMSIALEEKEVTKLYRQHGFTSKVIEIVIDGKAYKVLPKAVDLHPVFDVVRHADFMFLGAKRQKVAVPLVYIGKDKSIGLKRGGFLNVIKRRIDLDCPVDAIPEDIEIDVSEMSVGSSVRVKEIALPKGCELITRPDLAVVSITGRGGKSTDEEAEVAEGGEEAEASEAEAS